MRERYLSNLLKQELEASDVPAKVISAEVGIPYSTLMNQLNPDIPNAAFKADDLLPFMRATKSRAALEYLAAGMGCSIECMSEVKPDKSSVAAECRDTYSHVADFHEAIENEMDIEKLIEKHAKARRELDEDLVAAICARNGEMK